MTAETTCRALSGTGTCLPAQQTCSCVSADFRCQYLHGGWPKRDRSPVLKRVVANRERGRMRFRDQAFHLHLAALLKYRCPLTQSINDQQFRSSENFLEVQPLLDARSLSQDAFTVRQIQPVATRDTDVLRTYEDFPDLVEARSEPAVNSSEAHTA